MKIKNLKKSQSNTLKIAKISKNLKKSKNQCFKKSQKISNLMIA
jgi:hypothetical protein